MKGRMEEGLLFHTQEIHLNECPFSIEPFTCSNEQINTKIGTHYVHEKEKCVPTTSMTLNNAVISKNQNWEPQFWMNLSIEKINIFDITFSKSLRLKIRISILL